MSARYCELSDRVILRFTGKDRAKSLHNVTTQDIVGATAGQGREAFVTSLQGKTLGYGDVLVQDSAMIFRTDAAAAATVIPHLKKYLILDDTEFADLTGEVTEIHLMGEELELEEFVAGLGGRMPAGERLSHTVWERASGEFWWFVRDYRTRQPGLTAIVPLAARGWFLDQVNLHGFALMDAGEYDAGRISAGTLAFGRDVQPDNLPQELDRDAFAISFRKGCYLGQETVARLDALGHVNKILRGVAFTVEDAADGALPPMPPLPSDLVVDEKVVGTLTSAAWSAGLRRIVGLAMTRVKLAPIGTNVSIRSRDGSEERTWTGVITALPITEPAAD